MSESENAKKYSKRKELFAVHRRLLHKRRLPLLPSRFHLARDARRKRKLDLDNDLARTKQPSPLGTFRSFTIGVQPLSYKLVRLENVRVMIVRELR